MKTKDIVNGTISNIFKKEEELSKYRLDICKACKLYTINNIFGEVCNGKLYLNPDTDKTSHYPKEGYIKGCGCILGSKTRLRHVSCPTKKW